MENIVSGTAAASPMLISIQRFLNAVWALVLREFRSQYGKRKLGVFWAFVEPSIYIFVITVVLSSVHSHSSPISGSYAPFLALGLFNYNAFNKIERAVRGAIRGNKNLLSFPRVKPIDIIFSRVIVESAMLTVVFSTLMFVFVIFGTVSPPEYILGLLTPIVCSILTGFGAGLINAAIISYYSTWESICPAFVRINFFTSGLLFLARDMPPEILKILYYQPLLHTTEWIRSSWYPDYTSEFYVPFVPIAFALVVLFSGLLIERVSRTHQLGGGS